MCSIIGYGFTYTAGGTYAGGSCVETTAITLGARIDISVDSTDLNRTMIGSVDVYKNGTYVGSYESPSVTRTTTGLHVFYIPFTGLTTQVGTYNFGSPDSCVFVTSPDGTSQYCYSCTTTHCTSLTLTPANPCTNPLCGFTII